MFKVTKEFKNDWGSMPSFDELMGLEGVVYRQVERRKTFKFIVNEKEYFAKIHRGIGWGEVFKNLIQLRLPVLGAKNEFDAINALTELGVNTMTLAAFGQRGHNVAEFESFVITESLEPSISLEDFCKDWVKKKPSLKLKRALIRRVAKITKQLHENGINHRDLYICHFLLKKGDLTMTDTDLVPLYLIDLHRVQIRSKTPLRWQVKDLAALCFSSVGIGLTKRDHYRFIQTYLGIPLSDAMSQKRSLWRDVEAKALQLKLKPVVD